MRVLPDGSRGLPVPPGVHEQAVAGEPLPWTLSLAVAEPSAARRARPSGPGAAGLGAEGLSTRGR